MKEKIRYGIQKIRVNTATFSDIEIKPTLVNFFYGNNGTGKSTIAEAIKKNEGLSWEQGYSEDDYSIMVFDKKFITQNFSGFGNVPGVYTIGKVNAEIQAKVGEMTGQKKVQDSELKELQKKKKGKSDEAAQLWEDFKDKCWKRTETIRKLFPKAMSGFGKSQQFALNVRKITPVEHSINALEDLYSTANSDGGRSYPKFRLIGEPSKLAEFSNAFALLGQPITSSSDTEFARFVKAMNAASWVTQGHEHYPNTPDGKCPYCQQPLPSDIEEKIASCFDEQYQADLASLNQLLSVYTEEMNANIAVLDNNLQMDLYSKIDTEAYKTKVELLKRIVEGNIKKISEKIKEPSSVVTLDGIQTIRNEINVLIAEFNNLIEANNAIIADRPTKQKACTDEVWELIAFTLASEVSDYNARNVALSGEITRFEGEITTAKDASDKLADDITELSRHTVSTQPTIKGVNNTLRDAGFQGFTLHEKDGHPNVYEVRRQNGDIAENLSEGELNFIAFLYFYHLVRGSLDDSGVRKDRIVVIDDPVSSMDSGSLFIISALVRDMIQVCRHYIHPEDGSVGGEFIRQIFVLTHNTYFFKEISYNQVRYYDSVSFFLISKTNNISAVIECTRPAQNETAERENYTPVQNSYAALWSEFREVSTVIPTLSVIRRILEYYCIQLCGYDGNELRDTVLKENLPRLVDNPEDEKADRSRYHLADSMLAYLSTQSLGYNDGMHFVEIAGDAQQCKDVFKLLFECLGQDQHYRKMMDEERCCT